MLPEKWTTSNRVVSNIWAINVHHTAKVAPAIDTLLHLQKSRIQIGTCWSLVNLRDIQLVLQHQYRSAEEGTTQRTSVLYSRSRSEVSHIRIKVNRDDVRD